jgi:broad specificity phosphatase PhoE
MMSEASTSRRALVLLLPLVVALLAAAPLPAPAPATVVILVRHAERAPGTGDPPISETGQARARALAELGKVAGVQVIITTQFQRTQQTAAPLAEALGLTPVVVSTLGGDAASHIAEVAAAVRRNAGKTVLVVGHSNTIPAIVGALGGPRLADLCDSEYDNVFTMVLDAEAGVRTVRARFGAATPVDASCASMR